MVDLRSPATVLHDRLRTALVAAFGREHELTDPVLRPSAFADYQANVALALAGRVGASPREVAERLVAVLDVDDVCLTPEISGPGFVNLVLRPEWVAQAAGRSSGDARLGVRREEREVVPIDYSAPNVAKEMHVGHLRTTIVGDALARTLEHLGHDVVRQNHVGDWGTNFGMLIEHLLDVGATSPEARLLVEDPNAFYRAARAEFGDGTGDFADRARRRVVALQAGDPETLRHWERLVTTSASYFNHVYELLDVTLTDMDLAGESTYNDDLPGICDQLEALGLATTDDGALCVFPEGFTGREGKPVPLIVRKSDGGFGYATTDLATVRHRVRDLHADRVLYVVGATQSMHLQMVFATARAAGWLPEDVEVVHVQIGSMLGPDGKMFATRRGEPVTLGSVLAAALERAQEVVDAARPELSELERTAVARAVGIGAVKYADLSVAHDSSYVFDLERMLSQHGNTAPYLQYAAARLRSILRRATEAGHHRGTIRVTDETERQLLLALLGFGDVVALVGSTYEPHRLCTYLFELAQAVTTFYDACPVLGAEDADVRSSRLAICAYTLAVLEQGLGLLGITAPDRM